MAHLQDTVERRHVVTNLDTARTGVGDDLATSADEVSFSARSEAYADYFAASPRDLGAKLNSFSRFVGRPQLSRFLVRYELFKRVLGVQGVVIECGVYDGGGTYAFAQISSILEPLNHHRQIIGFDTFSGFPAVSPADQQGQGHKARVGEFTGSCREDLERGLELFDRGRALAHIPKIHFVEGDFLETGPRFLEEHPHLLVSLLYMDFDLAEPTKAALDLFLPRMPAGAIVAFDEVNVSSFPGETEALISRINLRRLRLERMPFTSISWATLTGDE
jgi:Macrocin-O-methyltransferase (TylF)